MATRNAKRTKLTRIMYNLPVLADAVIKIGEVVLRKTADGLCRQGGVVTGYVGIGIAMQDVDNTGGADGAKTITVEQGEYLLDNHGTNTVTAANLGANVYSEDQNTVGNAAANKSPVGPAIGLGWAGEPGVLVRIES